MKLLLTITTLLLLAACASGPPDAISRVPEDNPSLTRVRMDLDAFIGVFQGGADSRLCLW